MDAVDASAHYEVAPAAEAPALLTIVLDTNPRAWAALASTLPLSRAVANLLVFANAHLALSSTNQVAVVASHSNRAVWLYPSSSATPDTDIPPVTAATAANKCAPFRAVETSLLAAVRALIASTAERDLAKPTTRLDGALTLALAHIHKTSLALPAAQTDPTKTQHSSAAPNNSSSASPASASASASTSPPLHARILVVSVSDASPAQYIPTMNAVFAAAHAGVAIDVLALHGAATFLQQAAFLTRGTFLAPPRDDPNLAIHVQGILAYLMLGFGGTAGADVARALIAPTATAVDFRAACFCHRRVVDTGFVCSICLSIFCEVPIDSGSGTDTDTACPTCGSRLRLGHYGAKPAVVPRPKKKKKKRLPGSLGREGTNGTGGTGSTVGTPTATTTA